MTQVQTMPKVRYRFYALAPDAVKIVTVNDPVLMKDTSVVTNDGLVKGVTFSLNASEAKNNKLERDYETAPGLTLGELAELAIDLPTRKSKTLVVDLRKFQKNNGIYLSKLKLGL